MRAAGGHIVGARSASRGVSFRRRRGFGRSPAREWESVVSLVAEVNGTVVGHTMFSPVSIEEVPEITNGLGLAPVASTFGLRNEYGVEEAFMVLELQAGALPENGGLVKYGPEFASVAA